MRTILPVPLSPSTQFDIGNSSGALQLRRYWL